MSRLTTIEAQYGDIIDLAADRFGDHENMGHGRVLRWLAQFSDQHLELAARLLQAITYFGASNIRAMARELTAIVLADLRGQGFVKIGFIPVGSSASGSSAVARALRDVITDPAVKIHSMLDLSQVQPGELDAVVFVDDFSGTGQTLTDWWQNVEPLVRPVNASVYVGLLVLNHSARLSIEQFAQGIFAVTELGPEYNVFNPNAALFNPAEQDIIDQYCQTTGAREKYRRGRGGCGLLVSFRHGCPNNSVPILWYAGEQWRALFNRRGL